MDQAPFDKPLTEDEWPDEQDLRHDPADALIDCPYCGKSIHEDAAQCHHCGNWIIDQAPRRYPGWFMIALYLALMVMALIAGAWWMLR
jgi:predicted nucleic acid-binding Zn ribbon protein